VVAIEQKGKEKRGGKKKITPLFAEKRRRYLAGKSHSWTRGGG